MTFSRAKIDRHYEIDVRAASDRAEFRATIREPQKPSLDKTTIIAVSNCHVLSLFGGVRSRGALQCCRVFRIEEAVEGFQRSIDESRSITSSRRSVLAAALVALGVTGLWTASASSGEPDQKGQKSSSTSSESTQEKNEQLEQNQVSLKKSRIYTFVGKTGLGHQHGIEGQLKSGSIQLGAKQDAGELVFDMISFDADTDAARLRQGRLLPENVDMDPTRRQSGDLCVAGWR